jgi:hypothetical protein
MSDIGILPRTLLFRTQWGTRIEWHRSQGLLARDERSGQCRHRHRTSSAGNSRALGAYGCAGCNCCRPTSSCPPGRDRGAARRHEPRHPVRAWSSASPAGYRPRRRWQRGPLPAWGCARAAGVDDLEGLAAQLVAKLGASRALLLAALIDETMADETQEGGA